MMYSKKLEDIPKESYETFRDYINKLDASNVNFVRVEGVVTNTELDYEVAVVALSDLAEKGVLEPRIKIRCPECDQHLNTYKNRENVVAEKEICPCGNEFNHKDRNSWNIVYEIKNTEDNFFHDLKPRMEKFNESAEELPPGYFEEEFKRLKELENPQKRGRYLDYFVGLLFQQLEGAEVILKGETDSGEIDVFVSCLESPDWIERLIGPSTMIENKWEKDAAQTSDINTFHSKAQENLLECRIAYFLSINGFTSGNKDGDTGAIHIIRRKDNPKLIGLNKEDLQKMISLGNPSEVLKEKQFDI